MRFNAIGSLGAISAVILLWILFLPSLRSHELTPLKVESSKAPSTLFELMDNSELGVAFTNAFPREMMLKHALMNGSGTALGDYDGDGRCDIYLCNLTGANGLYQNLGGWKFRDVTEETGTGLPGQESTGSAFADLNGDGRLDLIALSLNGEHAVFLNQGEGRVEKQPEASGIASRYGATSMALADVDKDGDLDLYVCNYGRESILKTGGKITWRMVGGKPVVTGRNANRIKIIDGKLAEFGEPDQLYLNDGGGRFSPVSWTGGSFVDEDGEPLTEVEWFQGLSVSFRDMNRDGWPDLYICNDGFMPDRIWINRGDGTFRAIERLAVRQTSYTSMGVDFADIDRDGDDDFFVADMLARSHLKRMTQRMADLLGQPEGAGVIDTRPQYRRNMLYINRGDATYAETALYAGVADTDWSWGVVFLDADLDGWEDLFITNGFSTDPEDKDLMERQRRIEASGRRFRGFDIDDYTPLLTPNLAYRNRRDGRFEESGSEWGFDSKTISYGMAAGDLDNDGDLDLVINTLNAPPLIYRNRSTAPRVSVRLSGIAPNTQGIGARIHVTGGPVDQSQEVIAGSRYMSGDDPVRVFAAGRENALLQIRVDWPSGRRSAFRDAPANSLAVIQETESEDAERIQNPDSGAEPWFVDRSDLLKHRHVDAAFDDFARQPSLDRKHSQEGPGVAWHDMDGDGWDDLVIGTGRGGSLGGFRNRQGKGFVQMDRRIFQVSVLRDLLGVVCAGGEEPFLFATSSNYEMGFQQGLPSVLGYGFNSDALMAVAPDTESSLGSLALADVDGDGDLDLFAAGRIVPGQYPRPAHSGMYINTERGYVPDVKNRKVFESLGLVAAALFSDVDVDGDPDLFAACDWGNVRVFLNDGGAFQDATQSMGLASFRGRWTGLTTGDFNNDGLPDVVAGNLGLNTRENLYPSQRWRLVHGDVRSDGIVEMIPFYRSADRRDVYLPAVSLEVVEKAIPDIRSRIKTHLEYGQASAKDILEEAPSELSGVLEINTLESMLFLNRGGRFEAEILPPQAQWSPIFGMAVADFDSDGNEDVFCAQNFFANPPNTDRYAAGRGLMLKGDGEGRFSTVDSLQTGFRIYGEQRGAAVADFNRDGRPDLVVSQNGTETKLYENRHTRYGLRVTLKGGGKNPDAIGASLRLVFDDPNGRTKGPRREIQAGNGYLSQNAPSQTLGGKSRPAAVEVSWPDGHVSTQVLNPADKDIEIARKSE